jgi:TPR repeat protein
MYENGKGIDKDIPEAIRYYKLALENGYSAEWMLKNLSKLEENAAAFKPD